MKKKKFVKTFYSMPLENKTERIDDFLKLIVEDRKDNVELIGDIAVKSLALIKLLTNDNIKDVLTLAHKIYLNSDIEDSGCSLHSRN